MKKVKVIIDGITVEVPEGTTVLEAAKKINKLIPTFCYHDKLPIFGGCRMCLVWDKKWKSSIIACGTKVYDGMEIETENPQVLEDRKFILEMLFTRHPLDCPICDKAGECDLQNWGTYYGPQKNPYEDITPYDKIRPEENWESDYLEFVSNRCVLCLRCVSVCDNVNGASALFQEERGFEILISPDKKPMDTESSCEFCGLCVDICPVGAIIFKPFKFNARPWLLKETVSTCGMCSMQCPVAVDHDGQKIYRIRSTNDLQVCLGAYLGYDIHSKNRLTGGLKNGQPVSFNEALDEVISLINNQSENTAVVVSPYSSNETLKRINELAEKTGLKLTSTTTVDTLPTIEGFVEETGNQYVLPTEEDILKAEKIVVLGDDVANTTPVLSYFFHKAYFEGREIGKDKKIFYMGRFLDRLKKYNPVYKQVSNEELLRKRIKAFADIDESTVIIYSTTSLKGEKAFKFGKKLGRLHKQTGAKVLIIPQERNAFGVINNISKLYYLPDIIKQIEEGKIENLVLIGEDIVHCIEEDKMKELFMKLKNTVVMTPFNDGLALSSNVAIGSSLWFEEEGETEGFYGKRKSVPYKKVLQEKDIVDMILKKVERKDIKQEEYSISFYDYPDFIDEFIELWDFGYFSKRSDNLTNLKIKNSIKEELFES